MEDSTLWRVQSEFSHFWTDDFVVQMSFITIRFIAYLPSSYDEVRALQISANSLLRENQLLRQHNEELIERNRALSDQVLRLTDVVRRHLLP